VSKDKGENKSVDATVVPIIMISKVGPPGAKAA